jgi:glycopeptide antibiotics resistance protein
VAPIDRTTIALLGWTSLILMAGTFPLHNFVGHSHWEYVEWTVTPRHWRSPRFYLDIVANIVLFFPFGLLLARQFSADRLAKAVSLASLGLLLSMGIELFQVYCHNRHPSAIDLLSNTMGTAWGVLSAKTMFFHRLLTAWLPGPHSQPTGS